MFLIGIALLTGCSAKVGPRDGAVKQARRVAELEDEVARLEAEVSRLAIEFGNQASTDSGTGSTTGLPTPVRLVEASGSSVRLGRSEVVLRLRVRTEDVRNRFLQTTGPASISAIGFDAAGDPVDLGSWEVDAARWQQGLREGFMGTAYGIDLPIETPAILGLRGDPPKILVRAEVRDPRSSTPYTTEFAIPVIDSMGGGDP
ncbi:MAG: hypothetical protein GY895_03635 [Phycisphaera sp.]|nr:hypothetical protein [Phycisphaera sp.]